MARKKVAEPRETKKNVHGKMQGGEAKAKLRALFGDGIITPASEIVAAPREIIPISPVLDEVTGGGVQAGTFVTLSGPPGCGKTCVGLKLAKNWQSLGRKVWYFATEWRLYPRDLENVEGLDPSLVEVVRSDKDHRLTAQEFLKAADILLTEEQNIMLFMDSFSILADKGEMESDDYEQGSPASVNRTISIFVKRMTPILPLNNNLLVGSFHVYANIQKGGRGMAPAIKETIPSKAEHFRSTGLFCKYFSVLKEDGEEKKEGETARGVGQDSYWTVTRSMLSGGSTGNVGKSRITYGKGVDVNYELAEIGKSIGLITAAGSWRELNFLPKSKKVQGDANVTAYLDENPEHAELLYDKIREMRGDGE